MKEYLRFAQMPNGIRCISGMSAYDEKLINGRLVCRYFNACGQILPEMHLPDSAFAENCRSVFTLQVGDEVITDGWCLEKIEVTERESVMTLRHKAHPIHVRVHTSADGQGWITRELEIGNIGAEPLPICQVMPFAGTIWRHRFDNGILSYSPEECGTDFEHLFQIGYADQCVWGKEGDFAFHPLNKPLYYNGGMNGRSGWSRPSFVLQNLLNGQMLCCELAYSGNWEMEITPVVTEATARVDFRIGLIAPEGECIRVLAPDQWVRTPAVHVTLRADGMEKLIQDRHRYVREQIMPPCDPIGQCLIEANHRGYLCDRENELDIKKDMEVAAKAGVELYVIDAGWYGKEPNVWFNNVGDWYAGSWLPNDLYPLIEHAKKLGMKFGLWMEFEAAGVASDVRKNHPEFLLRRYGEPCSDSRALDMSNPVVVQWVEDQITQVISRYNLDMFRIDHNHHICLGGTRENGGYVENLTWLYFENLYAMLERLTKRFPNVSFQNCAAGGGRLDLGILRFFHHTEISDWARPPREMRIFNGMIQQLPPEIQLRICGTEVCEHVQDSDLVSQLHSIMQGRMIFRGISPTMEELAEPMLDAITREVNLYKQWLRPILTGGCLVYRHDEQEGVLGPGAWSVNEYALPDQSACFAAVHKLSAGEQKEYCLRLRGLDPARNYQVLCDRSGYRFTASGLQLMQQGLRLRIDHCLGSELVLATQSQSL